MANWTDLSPPKLLPPGVSEIANGFDTLSGALSTALTVVKTALELTRTLSSAASTDVVETTLNTLLEELQGIVDGLASNTTAHSIFIPVQKQPFGLGVEYAPGAVATQDRVPSYDTYAEDNGIDKDSDHPSFLVDFINNADTAVGGNRAFWRKLVTSLKDAGDDAKPDFEETYAVAGVAIVFGATTLDQIAKQAKLLQGFVKSNPRDRLVANTTPVVENLRTRVVPEVDSGNIGIVVEWDVVPAVQNPSLYSLETLIVDEIIVIRSTDPEMRQKFLWSEMFSSELSDDLSVLLEEKDYKVVARLRNDGFIRKFVDTDGLQAGVPYYYAAVPRYTLSGKRQPLTDVSNVVRVNYDNKPTDTRRSVAPNWIATPSLIEMFPVIAQFLGQISLAVESLTARTVSTGGHTGVLGQIIEQLDREICRVETIGSQLSAINDQLRVLLSEDIEGIYVTNVTVARGGINAWMAELARCLSDTSDTTRPPFDGTELTSGVVILAGGPNPTTLTGFSALLDLFFGSSSNHPLNDAINSIDSVITTYENEVFSDSLSPVPEGSITVDEPASAAFDENMRPVTQTDCG